MKEIDDIAYDLFCDTMTYDIRTNGYSKKQFIGEKEWFHIFYERANLILRSKKIKKIYERNQR